MAVAQQERPQAVVDGWLAALNLEGGFYLLIGLLAVGLRLLNLGNLPLSEPEAREALAAWRFVSMSPIPAVAPISPLLNTLISFTFWLLGANEFWARLWPMLAGVALTFTPLLFRRELGRGAALVASLLLAISPVMLAASRTVDGTTLAALSIVLIMYGLKQFVQDENRTSLIIAGIALGLGLASGPRFISGVVALAFVGVVIVFVRPQVAGRLREGWGAVAVQGWGPLVAAAIALIFGASTGLFNPTGLSAAGAAVSNWVAGWVNITQPTSPWLVFQIVGGYEPLLVVMGVGGLYVAFFSGLWHAFASRLQVIFGMRDPEMEVSNGGSAFEVPWREAATVLGLFVVGTLLYGLLYLGRQASDAVWVVIPLAMLAGKVVVETFTGDWFESELETVIAQAAVLIVMLVFTYFQLTGFGRGIALLPVCSDFLLRFFTPESCTVNIRLLLAGTVIALGTFVTIMFALGWSRLSAIRGAALALGIAALIGTLATGVGRMVLKDNDPNNAWSPVTTDSKINILMQSLTDISNRTVGNDTDLQVAVVSNLGEDDQNGLLGWEQRNFPNVQYVNTADVASGAQVVIATSGFADPVLATDYLGERYQIQSRQVVGEPSFQTAMSWWLSRQWATETARSVDLWVRGDVHSLIVQP
jgi:4-amino-4-deoxy-L-arabinose transferase-like glycosyltransferase